MVLPKTGEGKVIGASDLLVSGRGAEPAPVTPLTESGP